MKEIQLSQGKIALVDNEDYEKLNRQKWSAGLQNGTWYALGSEKRENKWFGIKMHRVIMNAPKGTFIDHKDGNGLNNQKSNLRFCTIAQNRMNAKTNKNRDLKGVRKMNRYGKYEVSIKFNKKNIYLGTFDNPLDASKAYQNKAKELFGGFARW